MTSTNSSNYQHVGLMLYNYTNASNQYHAIGWHVGQLGYPTYMRNNSLTSYNTETDYYEGTWFANDCFYLIIYNDGTNYHFQSTVIPAGLFTGVYNGTIAPYGFEWKSEAVGAWAVMTHIGMCAESESSAGTCIGGFDWFRKIL
jgi:hypothetical protein